LWITHGPFHTQFNSIKKAILDLLSMEKMNEDQDRGTGKSRALKEDIDGK